MTQEQKLGKEKSRWVDDFRKEMMAAETQDAATEESRKEPFATITMTTAEYDLVVKDAEARGAAEQRRKDAEGAMPVAWEKQNLDGKWIWTTCHDFHETKGTPTRPLYTRPANVAALEDRVKELEGVLKEAARALEQVTEGERGGYNARNGKFVCLRMSDGERADIIHCEVTEDCECALRALRSAIREGDQP